MKCVDREGVHRDPQQARDTRRSQWQRLKGVTSEVKSQKPSEDRESEQTTLKGCRWVGGQPEGQELPPGGGACCGPGVVSADKPAFASPSQSARIFLLTPE